MCIVPCVKSVCVVPQLCVSVCMCVVPQLCVSVCMCVVPEYVCVWFPSMYVCGSPSMCVCCFLCASLSLYVSLFQPVTAFVCLRMCIHVLTPNTADMSELEKQVRSVSKDGLLWGACMCLVVSVLLVQWLDTSHCCTLLKPLSLYTSFSSAYSAASVVPVAYGISKLQMTCLIDDEQVGTDFLEESITAFEDMVGALMSCM